MKQIGRNVYREQPVKYVVKLSFLSKTIKKYYEFRISFIERRINKYGAFSSGYQFELFHAAVYGKQSYLHKVEALYGKQELRDYKRRLKQNSR